jgi:hypothetical protein
MMDDKQFETFIERAQSLPEVHYNRVVAIATQISECEGDIPATHWCEDCKARWRKMQGFINWAKLERMHKKAKQTNITLDELHNLCKHCGGSGFDRPHDGGGQCSSCDGTGIAQRHEQNISFVQKYFSGLPINNGILDVNPEITSFCEYCKFPIIPDGHRSHFKLNPNKHYDESTLCIECRAMLEKDRNDNDPED